MKLISDDQLCSAAEALGERLVRAELMIATAESCTGGWIGKVCTDVAGSSRWYAGGVISYSNELKRGLLGVKADTLEQHGAVSGPVVREMAGGAVARLGVGVAVAVSGVAGPDGGTPDKPVGTVWIGAATTDRVEARCHLFEGDREAVRRASVLASFDRVCGLLAA